MCETASAFPHVQKAVAVQVSSVMKARVLDTGDGYGPLPEVQCDADAHEGQQICNLDGICEPLLCTMVIVW